ncbi:hypothetical protein ACLEDP_07445 [Lonsdalea quercina]|uniref:hypothetical protein n=1 Tax=Lonsdalea quercina TaxID=71657 RepID=UPI0039761B08
MTRRTRDDQTKSPLARAASGLADTIDHVVRTGHVHGVIHDNLKAVGRRQQSENSSDTAGSAGDAGRFI